MTTSLAAHGVPASEAPGSFLNAAATYNRACFSGLIGNVVQVQGELSMASGESFLRAFHIW